MFYSRDNSGSWRLITTNQPDSQLVSGYGGVVAVFEDRAIVSGYEMPFFINAIRTAHGVKVVAMFKHSTAVCEP